MKLINAGMNMVGSFYLRKDAAGELKELQEDYKRISSNMPGEFIDKTDVLYKRFWPVIRQAYYHNILMELKTIKAILVIFLVLIALGILGAFITIAQQL